MPKISPAFSEIGRGFAAYLAPPSPDVIRFTVGQPDFDTPDPVVQSAVDALHRGETAYTRSQGSVSLCEAVSEHLQTLKIQSNPDDVVVTPGCKQALLYALMTAITPGDEVLLLAPAWPSYDGMIRIFGGIPVHVPVTRPSYHPDFDALEASVTPRTKAIMLNSPNNPTGAVYTQEEIEKIAEFAERHDIWIVDDMIYSTLVWSEHGYFSPINFPGGEHRTVTIGGWSKGWAMTGWRVGYLAGRKEVIKASSTLQSQSTSNVCSFVQRGALAALEIKKEFFDNINNKYDERREILFQGLKKIKGIYINPPDGAFYAFPKLPNKTISSVAFCNKSLEDYGLVVVPGQAFGDDQCIRISCASSIHKIEDGLTRLEKAIKTYY